MPQLFSPLVVRSLTLKNRTLMPPMASETATPEGVATEETFKYYERRAGGGTGRDGTGLLIVEHTYVDKSGRRSARQFGLYDDLDVDSLAELTRRVHACGAAVGIQLTRAGVAPQREGKADLAGVGRALLAAPAWALKALRMLTG